MGRTKLRSSTQFQIDANLDGATHRIINVVDPVNAQDVATKHYVDTSIGSSLMPTNFVMNEVPTPTPDGITTISVLAQTPYAGKQSVALNGQKQAVGVSADYTIVGNVIVWNGAPLVGDIIEVDYIHP